MTDFSLARQAVKAWPRHALATRKQINALRRGYIKARIILGDEWLLAVPVTKIFRTRSGPLG